MDRKEAEPYATGAAADNKISGESPRATALERMLAGKAAKG
jgi:hypothetical protein